MDSSNIVLAGEYVTLLLYGLPLLHVLLALGKYTSPCADCKLPYRAIIPDVLCYNDELELELNALAGDSGTPTFHQ